MSQGSKVMQQFSHLSLHPIKQVLSKSQILRRVGISVTIATSINSISYASNLSPAFANTSSERIATLIVIASNYCEGQTRDGLLNGKGTCAFPSGNRYEGELRNGKRQGRGVFTFANGTRCEGEFKDDLLNGKGTCIFPSGNRYEGEFRENRREGMGTFFFADGARCEGVFKNDFLNGAGICTFANGNRYEGDFWIVESKGKEYLPLRMEFVVKESFATMC